QLLDRLRLVDPAVVDQLHALGPPGGAGGVDQHRQRVLAHRARVALVRLRVRLVRLLARRLQVLEGDHPVVLVLGRVEGDHLLHPGQVLPLRAELVDLLLVLGEDEDRLGVVDDVGGVVGRGRWINGGGRAARAEDAQVRQHPFQAGAGGDGAALLVLQPQRAQPHGDVPDPVADLLPAPVAPRLPLRRLERDLLGGLLEAGEEQLGDGGRGGLAHGGGCSVVGAGGARCSGRTCTASRYGGEVLSSAWFRLVNALRGWPAVEVWYHPDYRTPLT